MKSVTIRRVGNSNVISLPPQFGELGFVVGADVVIVATLAGELRVMHAAAAHEALTRCRCGAARQEGHDAT